jgi:glutathione S-transferase
MLKIFHAPRSRSVKLVWLAEEMGLPYEIKAETFGQPSAEFLAANPCGAFPAIQDGAVGMGESPAIMLYMMERYGPTPLALRPTNARYPDYIQFLIFGEASMAAFLNPIVMTQFMAPEGQKENFTTGAAKDMFKRRLGAVERQLEKSGDYLAGDFTAADISVAYALGFGEMLGLSEAYSPKVLDYQARLRARPAYQAAAAK